MAKKTKIGSFSLTLLGFVLAIYFINFFSAGKLSSLLLLNPKELLTNYNVWRLFTFPLAPGSTESVLLFVGVFYFIAPKLEKIINSKVYPILMFLIIFLQGVISTLLFWNNNVQIAGAEGLAFFMLTHTTLLRPNDRLYNMLGVKNITFSLSVLIIWLAFKANSIASVGLYNLAPSLCSALFGITTGLLVYAQIRYFQRIIDKRKADSIFRPTIPSTEELSRTFAKSVSGAPREAIDESSYYSGYTSNVSLSDDPDLNEETLNDILDKINESGKESLSPSEIKFLKDYSTNL